MLQISPDRGGVAAGISFRGDCHIGHDGQTSAYLPPREEIQEAADSSYVYHLTSLQSVTCITGERDVRPRGPIQSNRCALRCRH
jgi:hypothetical protein